MHRPTPAPSATRARLPKFLLLTALTVVSVPAIASTTARAEPADVRTPPRGEFACERGEFCLWTAEFYGGRLVRLDLRNTNPEECAPLPDGVEAHAFGNRIDRHVTVYQDRRCSTEGDFSTYPGPGTFVPRSPYVVRAVKIWD